MTRRIVMVLMGMSVLFGCEAGEAPERPGETDPSAVPAAGAVVVGGAGDLFIEEVPGSAQVLYVAEEDTRPEASRTGTVFVPMSTFSVERDGIPNEFPPAEEMASLLESAGVRGERFVIVGEPIPAGRAWAALDYLGLGSRAALLEGGPGALRAGSTAPATPAVGASGDALEVEVRDDMIVDAEWVRDRLDDPTVAILDARPPDQYSGETPGDGIERPGHIPGARNLFWETLVESADAPRLKDEAELRRLFEEAGVGPGDTVVAYCRTGGQGSFLYTVARHLGYDARLYDGSYVDWSRTDYPVEEGTGAAALAGADTTG